MAIFSCFLLTLWTAFVTCTDTEVAAKQNGPNVHDALIAKFAALETTTTQLAESVSRLDGENRNQALIIQELSDRLSQAERRVQVLENVADKVYGTVPETTDRDESSGNTIVQRKDKRDTAVKDGNGGNNPKNKEPVNTASIGVGRGNRMLLEESGPVAFFATITQHDVTNLGIRQAILFDNVVTNLGNAYHPAHGNFIAPYRGLYMFAATIAGNGVNKDWLYVYYMLNGNMVAQTHTKTEDMTSHTILLVLNPGDDVYLAYIGTHGASILGAHYSSFAGQLVTTM